MRSADRAPSLVDVTAGWQVASTAPGAFSHASELRGVEWLPATVPGTAAGALRAAGRPHAGTEPDLDGRDWWFRTVLDAEPAGPAEQLVLQLGGIATLAEVHLGGALVLESTSMFLAHELDVSERIRGGDELVICCRALAPALAQARRPRARWRVQLADRNLRFFRTMLLGRAPGFAPGPAAVGPWRPVRLERRRAPALERLSLRPRIDGVDGVLAVDARVRVIDGAAPQNLRAELRGPSGAHEVALSLVEAGGALVATGELRVPRVERWWPHTHGEPVLHDVRLLADDRVLAERRVGFRALAAGPQADHDLERDGLDLHVNGVRVFARGAVWTPLDPVGMAPGPQALRGALEQARSAGMNLLRLAGTGAYEEPAFHDLCDELGILVWQDFMFANFDYPIADGPLREAVMREARQVLEELAGRPSLAVLCGNSEVEQQVAMLGLDPELGRGELFGELLPGLARAAGADAPYLPSAPCGGALPFRTDAGVANYFGVGGYRRPLEDARRAAVRFASECLALANVPCEEALGELLAGDPGPLRLDDPRWKAGVARDVGSSWDFDDVRDHYLALLFGVDPAVLRASDHERYWELSRIAGGEVMAEVFGEWRRAGSPCGGGIVLWLRDLAPGGGWGLIDDRGRPKAVYHHLRRALAPVAVWTTDEGLNGVAVHIANDGPEAVRAQLRVTLYRDLEHPVDGARETLELAPHSVCGRDVEAMLGRFADVGWTYRFGPPAHDVIAVSLERDDELLGQAFRFPAGRPTQPVAAGELGLRAAASIVGEDTMAVEIRSDRLAYGVQVHAPGFDASDDAFTVEPGGSRTIRLTARRPGATLHGAQLGAVNLHGRVGIPVRPR